MLLTVSLVVVFGLLLGLLLKTKTIGVGSAAVAVLFGFLLASTGMAGPINNLLHAVLDAIGKVRA
ncbi:hypothetical protein Kpho02_07430 [Kitasatospora phosalacinea]|uniref:Uncharacterized protein n=1 Tax=Kitasatospora phosalacinea TaxID=2065 RepID=A0A9W6Q1X6_9ACTN|nr:hypothetical protein [Kitasatospora phosalacinea]GLW68444.1 hypothetical protein Kpho02_07430 [Kitasatospora phosalacinea]